MDIKKAIKLYKKCFGKNQDERYHAIAMLAIFGIFILFLSVYFRINPVKEGINNSTNVVVSPSPSSSPVVSSKPTTTPSTTTSPKADLNIVNYSYIYTINVAGVKEIITGKKYDSKEKFTIINSTGTKEYAKLSDNFLEKTTTGYTIVNAPTNYYQYCNIEEIVSLIENPDMVKSATYKVKTKNLVNLYNSDITYINDESLTDTISFIFSNGDISQINLDYSNYIRIATNGKIKSLVISIVYNDVGTTKDFDITVE